MNLQRHSLFWLILAVAATLFSARSEADEFADVRYDRQTDSLVITMNYRGTNPDHGFSLKWGPCEADESGNPGAAAEVLDDQYDDPAEQDFSKTVRLSLDGMPCPRPVSLTLRTAPRFIYTLAIPQ